jgi:hypothetical protein
MNNKFKIAEDFIVPPIIDDELDNDTADSEESVPELDINVDDILSESSDLNFDTPAPDVTTGIPMDVSIESPDLLEDIKENLEDAERLTDKVQMEVKLLEMKQQLWDEFSKIIEDLQDELEDLKERKVPEIQEFEIENSYRENLFTIACYVLDETLPQLFQSSPEYTLITNLVSKNYSDGTVSDAVIYINVAVQKDDYIHDFKAEVPILNGIAVSPTYIKRGTKIIPLTIESIQEELSLTTYQKPTVESHSDQQNIYTYSENRYKKFDKQKQYRMTGMGPQPVKLPEQQLSPAVRRIEKRI